MSCVKVDMATSYNRQISNQTLDCPLSFVPQVHETFPMLISVLLNGLLCIATGIVSVVSNLLVLMTIHGKPVFSSNQNILFEALASVDILTGVIAVPLFVAYQWQVVMADVNCILASLMLVFLQICTVFSVIVILLISLERSFAVFKPFKYQALVTRRRILKVLLTSWGVWLIILVLKNTFMHHSGKRFPACVGWSFVASFVLVGLLYLKICNVVKRHRNAIAALQTDPEVTRRILKQRKSLKTTIHVIGAFILCHMPLVLSLTLVWLGVISIGRNSFLFLSWTGLMVLVNSCLDPFIYCWRENRIRRGIIHLLRCSNNTRIGAILIPALSTSHRSNEMYQVGLQEIVAWGYQTQKKRWLQNNISCYINWEFIRGITEAL